MPNDDKASGPGAGISRREFLTVGGTGALATGLLSGDLLQAAEPEARPASGVVGPGEVPVKLLINGKLRALTLEPRVTLLDALRDRLDLTGAKKVCDRGSCGACTVILDGKPVYACMTLAIEAQGKPIETVEGLGSPDALHPIQAAFVEHDAQQCGFCTPGFVMATKAFLASHASPTLAEIERGMGGNVCRCGTYAGMRRAILAAASAAGRGGHA